MRMSRALLAAGLAGGLSMAALSATAAPLGDNVVVVTVKAVQSPETLPGDCVVKGVVKQVDKGAQFRAGQPIAIKVSCGRHSAVLDGSPERPGEVKGSVDAGILAQAKEAVAHLDDTGAVIWSPAAGLGDRTPWGAVAGFRILDGVKLPLSRDQLG